MVFWRGHPTSWSGHVAFVTAAGRNSLKCLGGNQSNAVNEKFFDLDRVLGFRWPADWPTPDKQHLRIVKSDEGLSTDES